MTYVRYIFPLIILLAFLAFPSEVFPEGRMYRSVPPVTGMQTDGFTAYDIERTADGFTWFATDRGLVRFDGENAVAVPLPGNSGVQPKVSALAATDDGGLIAATSRGVFRLGSGCGKSEAEPLLDGQVIQAACGLKVDGYFSLIGADEGLFVFTSDGKSRRIPVGRTLLDSSNKIVDMKAEGDRVFLLTNGGIYRLDARNLDMEPIPSDKTLTTLGVTSLAVADGNLYVGTTGKGIWRLPQAGGKPEEVMSFTEGNVVTDMETSEDGRFLYVGTDGGGVAKVDVASGHIAEYARHRKSDPVGPRSNQVYSILASNDLLWIGYYQNGADYTPAWTGPFELVDDPAVMSTRNIPVRALSISDGRITIGTREGVTVFEDDCSRAWTVGSPALRSEMVISLLDHGGQTYIGTYGGGVNILDPVKRQVRDLTGRNESVFRTGHIFSIAADNDGNVWFGTNNGLFRRSPAGEMRSFTTANSSLPEGNVYDIFFDSEGKGWVCTDTGLCVYDPNRESLRKDIFPSGFPHTTRFRTVYEDSRHRLYFVPETGMVFSAGLGLEDVRQFTNPLLQGADAKGVVEDSAGNIWLTTNRGIFRLDGHGHAVRFGLAAGLPSPSFLQGQPLADGEGHLWFGNSAGLLRLTEGEIAPSISRHKAPVPTVVNVDGAQEDFPRGCTDESGVYIFGIDRHSSTIEIGFSTFSYAIEEPDAYLYSLDGGKWQRFSDRLSVTLYGLSPGWHELKVKSANDPEGEPEVTVVRLKIPYPVWWYLAGVLILLLLSGSVGVWALMRRRRKSKHESAAKAAEAAAAEQFDASSDATQLPKKKYASNSLTRTEAREIAHRMEEAMENERPYLNADLKVGDLAALIGISSHKLSQFFSQHKQQTFYDYINSFRVEEFKRIAGKNGNLTLSAMAEQAGFSSRASFFRYFKTAEGISPGEWMKTLDKKNQE